MTTCGVYRLYHASTGQEYIGSSIEIEKRIDHHLFCLRANRHTSGLLQTLWNRTNPDEWSFEILVECSPDERLNKEQYFIDRSEGLLNHLLVAGSTSGQKWSEESRAKARESRRKYLETPGAREALAERARRQHASGKLGRNTWGEGSAESQKSSLKKRAATPEESASRAERARKLHSEGKLGKGSWGGGSGVYVRKTTVKDPTHV